MRSPSHTRPYRLALWILLLLGGLSVLPLAHADEVDETSTPPTTTPPTTTPPTTEVGESDADTERGEAKGDVEPDAVAPPAPMARPYLWVVDTQPRVFFCGTIHLPDPRVLVQPASVRAALDVSQVVLTEIDLRKPDLKAAGRIMRLPEGHLLSRMLPKKLYERTAAILAKNDVDIKTLEHTKIWAVTFRLQFAKKATDSKQVLSMDAALSAQAAASGKQIAGLETMSEQLRIFDGLDLNEQIRMLRSAVDSIDGVQEGRPSALDSLVEVYLKGDEKALYRYLCADMDPNDTGACCFMRKILDGRNERMLNRVFDRRSASPNQTFFVAVGAGHYPGRKGILSLLRQRGYRVRRVESVAQLSAPTVEPASHVAPPPPVIYYDTARFIPYQPPRVRRRVSRPFFQFPFFGPRRCR